MKRVAIFAVLVALAALPLLAGDTAAKDSSCCMKGAGIERAVVNIDNGVKITVTAKDATAIAAVQEKTAACSKGGCKDCPMHAEGVTRTVEKTASGVIITATASTPELVKKLQDHSAHMASAGCEHKAGSAACCAKGKGAKAGCCAHGAAATVKS